MSRNFVVERQDGITTIRLMRRLKVEDFLRMLDEIAEQDLGDRRLWDTTNNFNFSSDDIRQIAGRVRSILPTAERVAFVAADDLTFGQVRMFEAFHDQGDFPTRVFRNERDALVWLQD